MENRIEIEKITEPIVDKNYLLGYVRNLCENVLALPVMSVMPKIMNIFKIFPARVPQIKTC